MSADRHPAACRPVVAGIIRTGGIIAAGEGSRLKADGHARPKPLVTIGGVALVERVLMNMRAAGIRAITIIFNERDRECDAWVRERFPDLDLTIIVRTTPSSWASFREVVAGIAEAPAIISTVDTWCSPDDFQKFLRSAKSFHDNAVVLGVNPFALGDDERPLWVRRDSTGRVLEIGASTGDSVTAGLYVIPRAILDLVGAHPRTGTLPDFDRLRDFLKWIVESGRPVYSVELAAVVDVDSQKDIALAAATNIDGGVM